MEMEYSKGICLHLMARRNLLNSHTRILSWWNNVVYRLVVSASGGWVVYKLGEYTTKKGERERLLGNRRGCLEWTAQDELQLLEPEKRPHLLLARACLLGLGMGCAVLANGGYREAGIRRRGVSRLATTKRRLL